jgi:hypothetical protein
MAQPNGVRWTGEELLHPKGGSLKQTRDHIPRLSGEPRVSGWAVRLLPLGLCVMFATIAYAGANIIAFERLERGARSLLGQPIESISASISTWKNTAGVARRARNVALALAETKTDAVSVESALDELVKVSPVWAAAWQTRAAYQRALGAPMERVLPGFRMSVLTGSHEGYQMTERVKFGLEYWSELPDEDRRTVIRDLVGSAAEFGPDMYRNIVARKSQAERDDISAAVMASGRGSKELLQKLLGM